MKTPICDFVRRYREKETLRLHMPGHKGISLLGMEALDITEIEGADSLYEANGIILESEQNAATLFGSAKTLYSTEGSSQAIRAMLYLAQMHAVREKKKPRILAARNAHKTFVTAAGLLDLDVDWLCPSPRPTAENGYLCCKIDPIDLERAIRESAPTALYLTSPDYLGNLADLAQAARICHAHGVLLLVDNAHGAYLHFLSPCAHPLDLGADLCCDSAHKTLPALTGAAYLHLSRSAPAWMPDAAKDALALFGSTSPSYLILQSLDATNAYLANGYRQKLAAYTASVAQMKERLSQRGMEIIGDEAMKLTLAAKAIGYTGTELASLLRERGIECEFADPDYTVMMLSCELGEDGLRRLEQALYEILPKKPIDVAPPSTVLPKRCLSIRTAMLSPRERIPARDAEGRILAAMNISCPPAVPIAVCGELLTRETLDRFAYYNLEFCDVVKE